MNSELVATRNRYEGTACSDYLCNTFLNSIKISVVLPAYNEEISIGSIVLLTRLYVDNVIVVDDGSSDRTSEIAKKAGAEVIVHERNKGKGVALKTGFKAAVEMGADVIVTMDSDGQHNPADIPKLLTPIIEGNIDMVLGSRYLTGLDKNTPFYRRIGQTILDVVSNASSGFKVTDSQSGFRAFTASTSDVFRFCSQGMAIESEMLVDAGKAGLRIKEVGIGVRYDVDGSTLSPVRHGVEVLTTTMNDIGFKRPLFYFTVPGIFLGLVGFYMVTHFLQTFAIGGGLSFVPTIIMTLLVIVWSSMILTGILLYSLPTMSRKNI
jgi:glycosyltransferase involved in cell wall biosynthesis